MELVGLESIVKLLLDTGKMEVNSKDTNSRTPLSWAAQYRYEAIAKLLLDTGKVVVDSKDSNVGPRCRGREVMATKRP